MTKNIFSLVSNEPETGDVVDFLEGALEKARVGEYSSVAIATVGRDGSIGCGWSSSTSLGIMTGSAARLLHRINQEIDE